MVEIKGTDTSLSNTWVIYLFVYSSCAIINSSQNSPMPSSHVWYIMYPSGNKIDTSLGNSWLMLQTHLHVCVPNNSAERKQKEHPRVCRTDPLERVGVDKILSTVGLKEHMKKQTWLRPKLWTHWGTWQSRRGTGASGAVRPKSEVSVEMKTSYS